MSTSFYPISNNKLVSQDLNCLKDIALNFGFKMIKQDNSFGILVPIDHFAFNSREAITLYMSGDYLDYPSTVDDIAYEQCFWVYPDANNQISFMMAGGGGVSLYHAVATLHLLFECYDSLCEYDYVELLELAGIL